MATQSLIIKLFIENLKYSETWLAVTIQEYHMYLQHTSRNSERLLQEVISKDEKKFKSKNSKKTTISSEVLTKLFHFYSEEFITHIANNAIYSTFFIPHLRKNET